MTPTEDNHGSDIGKRGLTVDEWRVEVFDTIDSTNRYLLESGADAGAVAAAEHQSAGRGRRGRVWDSKPGASLLFSVLFQPDNAGDAPLYGQAMALAVTDACKLVGDFDARIKWPNDVLVGDRKLAGILAESNTTGDNIVLVVGTGINLNWEGELPEALPNAISADEAAGHRVGFSEMLSTILKSLDSRLAEPEKLTDAYRERCSTLGQQVRIEREAGDLVGRAIDVTETGALVLEAEGVQHVVTVGEAVHLRLV